MTWHRDLKDNIVGIPLEENPPEWQSSTPVPEWQLKDLGTRGPFVSNYEDYKLDEGLSNLVSGKRIAYVCPSPHLKGQKMGSLIDSYDLVVRVNQAFHTPEDIKEDYGERTDVLMNCLNILKIQALYKNLEYARSLKYIVCPMVSMWDIQRVEAFLDYVGTPWHNVSDGYLFKIFKEVGTTCNTGLTGIITLLNYDIKELYVTGMTFFNMNNFGNVYHDAYQNEASKYNNFKINDDGCPNLKDLRMDIHHQQPQIDYFRKILSKHYGNTLFADDYIKQNFNL
tara:strand:- start:2192 stop:3037 length:846 start_codon:yes stop_codon:yes gene_type:complete